MAMNDKVYAKGYKFADRMNYLLRRMQHELQAVVRKKPEIVKEKNNTGLVIGALASGLLIGSVISLLIAPDSGKNTREKITKSLKDPESRLKRKSAADLDAIKVGGESALERAKKTTKEMNE